MLESGGVGIYTRQAGSVVYPLHCDALKNSKINRLSKGWVLGCLVESWSAVSILVRILLQAPLKAIYAMYSRLLLRDILGSIQMEEI